MDNCSTKCVKCGNPLGRIRSLTDSDGDDWCLRCAAEFCAFGSRRLQRLEDALDALIKAGEGMRVGLVYDLSEGGAGALVEKDPWRKHRQALAAAKGWRKEPSDG